MSAPLLSLLPSLLGCSGYALDLPPNTQDSPDSAADTHDSPADSPDSPPDTSPPPGLPFCINEWMPDNQSAVPLDGQTPDWLELHNPTDAAIPLDGWSLLHGEPVDGVQATFPLSGTLDPGAFSLLYQGGDGPADLPFDLNEAGDTIGLLGPEGQRVLTRFGAVSADSSIARSPDCCDASADPNCLTYDFRGTPASTNTPAPPAVTTFLPLQSTWRYSDGATIPDDWMTAAFDDAAWPSGVAPLGYGDSQTTVIGYGPDPNNKHPAAYFRLSIDIPDIDQYQTIRIGMVRDDGLLLYANDQEVIRNNLPAGAIGPSTYAAASVGAIEEYTPIWFEVAPLFFRSGPNQLAVEVHQHSGSSSDLTFDLSIEGVLR